MPRVGEREPLVQKVSPRVRSYYVEPVDYISTYIQDLFTPVRLGVICVLCISCFCGFFLIPPEEFTISAGEKLSVTSHAGCQYHCQSTHTDDAARKRFGGLGVCQDPSGRELAKYQLCDPHALNSCVEAKERADLERYMKGPHKGFVSECRFRVVADPWKPYFVFAVTAYMTFLICQNVPAEVCLMGACCIFAAFGIISAEQAFRGIANPAVVSIAFMYPIAAAVEETGVMKSVVMPLLGHPSGLLCTIPKMFVVVMLVSGFISNRATVAMMIPLLTSWAHQMKVHPGKLFMNLTYAAQLGGSITLIGSSNTLVAAQSVASAYVMKMFDTFPLGVLVGLITMVVCTILSPTRLLQSGAAKKEKSSAWTEDTAKSEANVSQKSSLAEEEWEGEEVEEEDSDVEVELGAAERGHAVRHYNAAPGTYAAYFVVAEQGNIGGGKEFVGYDSLCLEKDLRKVPGVVSATLVKPAKEGRTVLGGEVLVAIATAQAVVELRNLMGLMPLNRKALLMLGGKREKRRLYEGVVENFDSMDANYLRRNLGLAVVATRRSDGSTPWRPTEGKGSLASKLADKGEGELQQGDVVLFEANPEKFEEHEETYTGTFNLISIVPDSMPPRRGHYVDYLRKALVLVSATLFVILVSLGHVPLCWGAGILITLFFVINAVNEEKVYRSIRGDVLLAVGSAFGVATAVEKTGLANFVAAKALVVAGPYGMFGMAAVVYLVANVFSMCVNNAAVVAMMGPMLIDMVAMDPSLDLKCLTWVMIMASGACFCTPLGFETNLMVQPIGEYLFVDFSRFGIPVQLVHAVATITLSPLMARALA